MICHFNHELNDKRIAFKEAFCTIQRGSQQSPLALEECLPWKSLFLQDYCSIEKLLVLLNLVLFGASMCDRSADPNVHAALIYLMLAGAYFAGTSAFLMRSSPAARDDATAIWAEHEKELGKMGASMGAFDAELSDQVPIGPKANTKPASAALGKKSLGKRVAEPRKLVSVAAPVSEKKSVGTTQTVSQVRTRARRNVCSKVWLCVQRIGSACEHYATALLRLSFFAMNLTMLHFCMVQLD